MQPPVDSKEASARESTLLLGVAGGLGCFLLICAVIAVVALALALIWTSLGQLGPNGAQQTSALFTPLLPAVSFLAGNFFRNQPCPCAKLCFA